MPKAIVVGGGIIGASVAHALATEAFDVLVLEAGVPAGGTTAAGMGHIVVMDDSDAQFDLTRYSRALLDELISELPSRVEYQRCGTMWLAEAETQLQAARDKHGYYTTRGVRAELLDALDLAKAEPNLRPGLAGALLIPDDGVLYPPAFARVLLERAAAHGCRVESARVEVLADHTVTTPQGRLIADVIVNAAGAAAARLTPELPIVPRKGHLVITDRYAGFSHHQLVELGYLHSAHSFDAASVAFNLQPRRTGQMLIGSSRELVGWDATINRQVVQRMLQRALAFMPSLAKLSAIRTWMGFRPSTPDKLPLIGRWRAQEGVWIAAGHEGLGITTALATGRLLVDAIMGRSSAIDGSPFDPMRSILAGAA